jgi:hypothetical protein
MQRMRSSYSLCLRRMTDFERPFGECRVRKRFPLQGEAASEVDYARYISNTDALPNIGCTGRYRLRTASPPSLPGPDRLCPCVESIYGNLLNPPLRRLPLGTLASPFSFTMDTGECDYLFKLLLIGDQSVGKVRLFIVIEPP